MGAKRRNTLLILLIAYSLIISSLFVYHVCKEREKANGSNPLLAKRIDLENASNILINFEPLRKDLRDYLDSTGLKYSIYFEYLFSGTSIKDTNNDSLVGASLMKIPLIMDLYKLDEEGKIDLDKQITISKEDIGDDPEFGNVDKLQIGDKRTLRELAKSTLTGSDNTSALAIFNATKGKISTDESTINRLGIETTVNQSDHGDYALISAREYSNIFKCLYFSCQLTKEHSSEILNYLTQARDDRGLRSGTPEDIVVSHKIGSFSSITQSDCGIVYQKNRRYILCVMLDADKDVASKHIRTISEKVSDYVKNQ